MNNYNWIPVVGRPLEVIEDKFVFKGETIKSEQAEGLDQACVGLHICDQIFTGGKITAKIKFSEISRASCCDIIIAYDPVTSNTLDVGVPGYNNSLFAIRSYLNSKWEQIARVGDRSALVAGREYSIKVVVAGSVVTMFADEVELMRANLPSSYIQSQVGLLLVDHKDIEVSHFEVESQKPKAFVVMQLSAPYNDLYLEVIKSVCSELGIEVLRIDESRSSGLIISDIIKEISESTFVIADITPVNANVFYEVGYAHGLNKPTILLAETNTKLPFDVSPFRTLFYENSIGGKPKLERGLREYIQIILADRGANRRSV